MSKKYYRSTADAQIAGVCGGIASYFDIDPILVRTFFVAMLFLGLAPALVLYGLLWAMVPARADAA